MLRMSRLNENSSDLCGQRARENQRGFAPYCIVLPPTPTPTQPTQRERQTGFLFKNKLLCSHPARRSRRNEQNSKDFVSRRSTHRNSRERERESRGRVVRVQYVSTVGKGATKNPRKRKWCMRRNISSRLSLFLYLELIVSGQRSSDRWLSKSISSSTSSRCMPRIYSSSLSCLHSHCQTRS
jgi:hypothetical protein